MKAGGHDGSNRHDYIQGVSEMNEPRQQHYVPKCYLRGFTPSGDADEMLNVIDCLEAKRWKARPAQIARERDFYTVEGSGINPYEIEEGFSKIEGMTEPVLSGILESRELPQGDNFDILINFVGMMAMRVPGALRAFSDPMEEVGRMMMEQMFSTPDLYHRFLQEKRAKGEDISDAPSFEQMKEAVEQRRIVAKLTDSHRMASMFEGMIAVVPLLLQRSWFLAEVKDPSRGRFICSDRPVSLAFTESVPAFYGPGFGMRNTEISFPLGKEVVLIGNFSGRSESMVFDPPVVAAVNARTAHATERFIYFTDEQFFLLNSRKEMENTSMFMQSLQARKEATSRVKD
jgi:hypothetical protein